MGGQKERGRLRPISTSANFDVGKFLDVEFLDHKGTLPNLPRRVVAPILGKFGAPKGRGGGPNLEKVGLGRVGLRRVEAQNFAFFFSSPATVFILFSFSCWSFRGILVVFEAREP